MNTNKAPDKIYFPEAGLPSYIDWDGSPIRTKQVDDSDICYVRKDALMEWLENKIKIPDVSFINGLTYLAYQDVIKHINEM